MLQLPPLALYVHIPWCVRKCPYCDFNSHEANEIPEQGYVQQLLRDLAQDLPLLQGRKLTSIFFGGGTPSLFSASAIAQVIHAAREQIGFADDIEITLEANPGTAEAEKFQGFREAGVNRLSLGVQSFNATHLKTLGRIHDSAQAVNAVRMAQAAGFARLNIDLMHGLPGQTVAQALDDVQRALDLGVTHLSWYQLTIEPNTAFFRQPPPLPPDDHLWEIQQAGQALLRQQGFLQYEVSAYAKPGDQARHNLNYWQFGDYLGIGAGAHGKITLPREQRIVRYSKTRVPQHYLQADMAVAVSERWQSVPADELPFEFLMNALRLRDGVPAVLFTQRTGLPLSVLQKTWQQLGLRELVLPWGERLCTTEKGFCFLNDVLTAFMAE